ncbi:PstS family phosphate ABC transporter substrate-binding protein [Calothrix sp. PCC 6303]|uniref:PstS family phosphate ABC transporter substrate-binding protein n=1 Tax=Calothrix sp. PCC 6303 TaxID=1170562 RepID=UPI0002A036A5|nr:substrate-binding domain-containing protein [Calothrix sp. PCC 6303]AFZ00806.1 phosphate ABC transporter substrate-binding protein, PhoT family [Calothrix sp. PCC 6303]
MTKKNETVILVSSLAMTLALVGGVYFWVSQTTSVPNILHSGNKTDNQTDIEKPNPSDSSTFAKVSNVPSGLFRYGGSTTWAPIRAEVDSIIKAVYPQFGLIYTAPVTGTPGTDTGIRMLIDNQLVFSQASRSLQAEEYQQAQQKGFTLKEIPVAVDGIAVAVHPNLDIPGLTLAQLRDIYTGKLTNWNQLGSKKNLPIVAYSRSIEDGGTVEFFVKNVLGKEKLTKNIQFTSDTTEALRNISKKSGGIYYASAPEIVGQCGVKPLPVGRKPDKLIPPYQEPFVPLSECPKKRNQVNIQAFQSQENQYPITRQLFVIIKQNAQTEQQAGEAYANLLLTNQGQELITKAGFVRIK